MSDPQQQPQSRNNKRTVAGLFAVFSATPPILGYARMVRVRELLADLAPSPTPQTVEWLVNLTAGGNMPEALLPDFAVGPARRLEEGMANAWLAMYLVAAAARLADAEDADQESETSGLIENAMEKEERYFEQHLRAEERRLRAAALQDAAAKTMADRWTDDTEGLLGWRSLLDERTTPECRWAHGKNYRANTMPVIGWPGAVHMKCRCTSGPPVPGAPLIPSA